MSDSLRYGQVVTVDIPDETKSRKSVMVKSGPAGGLVVDTQKQTGQKRWIIRPRTPNTQDGSAVHFGHLISLEAADGSGNLGWLSDNSIGVTKDPRGSAWVIQNPDDNVVKSDELNSGDEFVLGSMIGPYLSRREDFAKNPAVTLGEKSTWTLHLAGAPAKLALRYGNMISISSPKPIKRVAALNTYVKGDPNQNPNDMTRAVTCDDVALADSSKWTIVNPDDLSSTSRVGFGDIVCLSAGKLRGDSQPSPRSYYLSYRNDHLTSDGHRKIGAVPAIGAWERWRIVDPGNPMSELYAGGPNPKFGDTFALKAESGNGEYLSRTAAGGVSTSSTLGEAEKWTAENVFTAVDSKIPDPTKLPRSTDNSAAVLNFGSDVEKTLAKGIAGALGKGVGLVVPAVGTMAGTALEGLVGMFWPSGGGVDIWELIKTHVEELVNEKIQDERINTFQNKMNGIKDLLERYRDMRTKDRRAAAIEDIIAILTSEQAQGVKLGDAQRVLPYQVMLGTFHIAALHETFVYGPDYWGEDYLDAEMDRAALKQKINFYSELIKTSKAKALEWRRGLIAKEEWMTENNPDRGNKKWTWWRITDRYVQSHGYLVYWDYDIDAAFERYTQNMLDIFSQQLEDFLAPYYLWRYMDPDCEEVPMKRTARTVTGPYGLFGECESDSGYPLYNGDVFFYDPKNGPLTEISLTNGDIVYGIQARYGDRGDWHGSQGENRTLALGDTKIIAVEGKFGWSINTLKLVSDRERSGLARVFGGLALQAGRDTSGNAFTATPPADTDGFLTGISGYAKDTLDTLYLHWQYTRWE